MKSTGTLVLSLTGPDSHTTTVEPGQGSLTLGPIVPGARRPDVVVDVDDVLDWSAFDPFTVPAGYPWPRFFAYHGNDTGFLDWSRRRRIERFHWRPAGPTTVDAGKADISELELTVNAQPVEIVLPATTSQLSASRNLGSLRLQLASGASCPSLYLYPATRPSRDAEPVRLPSWPSLDGVTAVGVGAKPLRQPFDCASLSQFPRLAHLRLWGQLTNLAALRDLTELRTLQFGDCPDLGGLPPLTAWPRLESLHASNVAEEAGADLRRQARVARLAKASISRLRTADWFETDYGLPFKDWPAAQARPATKAYRAAEALAADDPESGIRAFVRAINGLPGIFTIEREDAAEAVVKLAARAGIEPEVALRWFDAERDF